MTIEEKIKYQLGELIFNLNIQALEIENLKKALVEKQKETDVTPREE